MSPYNLSLETFLRSKGLLDLLLDGKEKKLVSHFPHQLAYRIREAIKAAEANKIDPYQHMKLKLSAREGYVLVRHREELLLSVELPDNPMLDVVTEYDVVGVLSKATKESYTFPAFRGNVQAVERWATKKGWAINAGPPLRAERRDADV